MKKLFLAFTLALGIHALSVAQSETFKAFKIDVSIGPTYATAKSGQTGLSLSLEPKFAINDKITLGLRLETALRAYSAPERFGLTEEFSGSYIATADYYLNTNGLRPFVGIGAGIMEVTGGIDADNDAIEKDAFGFVPRAGFETGHFRVALEYNIATQSNFLNSNYASLKVGLLIGGGRK